MTAAAPAAEGASRQNVLRELPPFVVATLPFLVAAIRGLVRDWIPIGDNAYFAVRAHDVLTEHHPLVGAWSSGSMTVGVEVNNLGPLQLDLLAPTVKLFGWGPGTLLGVTLTNLAAALFVVACGRARLGARGAWLGALVVTALAWTLGNELLLEARQHQALVLPFLAVLFGVWCSLDGDHRFLPWTVGLASLVAQTHLTFAVPLATLGSAVAARLIADWRATRASRGDVVRWLAISAVVLVLCWAQPLWDQVWGRSNLSAVARAGGEDGKGYGARMAARAVADLLVPAPGWLRPAYRDFHPVNGLPGTAGAASILAAALLGLGAVVLLGWRRRVDGPSPIAAFGATALAALLGGWLGAVIVPVGGPFGAIASNFRFLWPIAAMVWAALVAGALELLPQRAGRLPAGGLAAVALLLVALNVPVSYQSRSLRADLALMPVARELAQGMAAMEGRGPVAVDRGGLYFGEPYSYVVLAGLQEHGVEFRFDEGINLARFGAERRLRGDETGLLQMRAGSAALSPPAGTEVIVDASLLDAAETAELEALERAGAEGRLDAAEEARLSELRPLRDRGTVAVWFTPGATVQDAG